MSNHNSDKNSEHRKSKGSLAMTISQGLGGPKGKPKGVPDGQPVNIPAPCLNFFALTEASKLEALLDLLLCFEEKSKERMKSRFWRDNLIERLSQKICKESIQISPYRKPTQVDRRKSAKVNG